MNQPYQFNVRQEADYVLGMMDLYENDGEITGILRTKGLTTEQINQVLALAKRDGYTKRLRQAKRIMFIGFGITIAAGTLYAFLISQKNFTTDPDALARLNARSITAYPFYFLLYGIGQSVYGVIRYFTYSKKIRNIS